MSKQYVIIGGGVSAVHAAKAIRDQDQAATILLFTEEYSLPYNRIKLSKDLYSDLGSEKVLIKKQKFYHDNQINVRTNIKIEKIDTDHQTIVTASKEQVTYDKLLICTGATNRKLPVEGVNLSGVYSIRNMQEANDCKAYLQDKKHVVVIGGGVQGLETACSFYKADKMVSMIELDSHLMSRQLDEKTSLLMKKKVEDAGIHLYLNIGINSILGNEQVEAVQLQDGRIIPCDAVVYSIGIIPNTEIVEGTKINTNRGIIVNDYLETSEKHVFAAGDVSEWNGKVEGLWGRAMDQGKIAGINMAGTPTPYEPTIPVTIFNAFDLSLFSIGMVNENQYDKSIACESSNECYTRVFIKNNKMVGVISLEGVAASTPYLSAIKQGVSLEGINLEQCSISDLMKEVKDRLKNC
ncbi:NAD(P)/FAD-dependent oxidoreductase [Brevibacillus daliensis]|uniref:NAD(P)/FAD-dependent oxidoreductase n=1 Tax=Brevibacillus daliensis TaxID=2892995 RepID=UPI001E4AFB18|nr:FAD-dependent oxidoreductase [Brevibacillus daliensis]